MPASEPDDIVVDCGNSPVDRHHPPRKGIRRKCKYFGSGVSAASWAHASARP